MKKTLLALAITSASLCALPALAQDDTVSSSTSTSANGNYQPNQAVGSGNWFIGANVGQAHVAQGPYNDHPTTYALTGGYRWKVGQDVGLGVDIAEDDAVRAEAEGGRRGDGALVLDGQTDTDGLRGDGAAGESGRGNESGTRRDCQQTLVHTRFSLND